MSMTRQTIVDALAQSLPDNLFKKVTVVGNDPVEKKIGDVRFLCATLWTDYGPPEVHAMINRYIRDHSTITNDDGSYVTPTQLSLVHHATVAKFGEWMEGQDNGKTVVCTHHMPSFQAVDPMYMTDPTTRMLNHAFTSNLDDFILKHQPAIWTFGHTHTRYFGKIGNTQLVCNPLGYPQENNQRKGVYDSENLMSL
jgi:hypothetical protein